MKTAIIFSGGGAKGANQVGILKAMLENETLDIMGVYGTSVGALNSTGFSYIGMEGLENIWLNIKSRKDIIKVNWKTLGPVFGSGIFTTKPLRQIIDKTVDGNKPAFPIKVCKVHIETGKVAYGKNGDPNFKDSVEASTCIPLSMQAINNVWVDGGVREITPLKRAIEDGADKVIVILASPWQRDPNRWKAPKGWSFFKSLQFASRAVDILAHEVFIDDIKSCHRKNNVKGYKKVNLQVYAPRKLLIDTLDFNPEKIRKALKHGYESYLKGSVIL